MSKPEPLKLKIKNVVQEIGVSDVEFARKLNKKVIRNSQKILPNGNIQITIELDPTIQGVKNV